MALTVKIKAQALIGMECHMFKKLKALLLSLILIFPFNQVFAADVPVIVIAPSKKVQSTSTVGSSVVIYDENQINN